MAYRDDRQALELQLTELQRRNEELEEQLSEQRAKARAARAEDRERRHGESMKQCTVCGGALLPVAVFAGHNDRSPLPLRMSTIRFVNPSGGFTHSAPILAKACSSCGFIHHFIDLAKTAPVGSNKSWVPVVNLASVDDKPSEPDQRSDEDDSS